MKKFSKILVLLLTFSLLLGALAVFASADVSETDVAKIGDKGYETFDAAFKAAMEAEEPVTITLLENTASATAFTVSKSVTIDLNWFTLDTTGASAFTISAADVALTVKNGSLTHTGTLVKMTGDNTTFNAANLYALNKQTSKNHLFVSFAQSATGYTQNVNLDNCVSTYDPDVVTTTTRVFDMQSSTINMDVRNSYIESYASNVFRVYTTKLLWGEVNFTNSYLLTGGAGNARLMECGSFATPANMIAAGATIGKVGSGDDLEVELLADTTYRVVKNNLAEWNFYNCHFYNDDGDATIAALAYNMHYYGGYYYNSNDPSAMVTNTYKSGSYRDVTGLVYFHTYTDEAGNVYYPTFNQDPSKGIRLALPDFTKFDTTYTYDGTDYGPFIAANKTANADGGKIVANANTDAAYTYVFVPAGDASTPSVADPIAVPNAVAMLNGKLYSDFGLAAAAAGEGDIITLLANVSGGTEVTAPVTVNTNGFEFAPSFDTAALMTETVQGNLAAIVEVAAGAEFIKYYYWQDAESSAAANDEENGFDWDSFDWEAGIAPEGLIAYKALPVGSSADVTSVGFVGVDLSYVDEESNYFSHTGWEVIGGSEEEFYFDYTPKTQNVGKATFLIIDDATGAIIGSGYTDADAAGTTEGDTANYSAAFTNAMYTASAGTTIKLVADIELCSDNNKLSTNEFTLDLNGHTLYLSSTVNCVGKSVTSACTDTGGHAVGTNAMFRTPGNLKLTVKSSLPGGTIYNSGTGGNQFCWVTSSTSSGYITFEGENLTVYSATLIANQAAASTTAPFQINLNGGKYYTVASNVAAQGYIAVGGSAKSSEVNIKNAFIDSTGHQLFSVGLTVANVEAGHKAVINIEDSVILHNGSSGNNIFRVHGANTKGYDLSATYVTLKGTAVLGKSINNPTCYPVDADTSVETYVNLAIKENCFFSHEIKCGYTTEGCELKALSGGYKAVITSTYGFAKKGVAWADANTAEYIASITNTKNYEYAYGTTYATVDLTFGGETVTQYVYVPEGGTTVTLTESATENYIKSTYTATVAVAEAGKTYTGTFELTAKEVSVSGIKYNLTLASEIAINVAVPADVLNYLSVVVDGKTFTKENATPVTIGEAEYYVITYTGITATDTVGTVEFAIVGGEGVTPANVVTSVAAYANKLMTKGANDTEKELGRALIVYTLEAYKALDAENTAAIDALTAYAAAVPEDESFMAEDTAALAAYFEGAFLRLESTPGIVFVAKEAAIGKTFTFTYVDENLELVSEEVTFTAEKLEYELEMKVYNLDQDITFTVDGSDTALSYNLDTYLASLATSNNAFAQAIYRYVNAAKAYVTAE